MTKLAKPAAPAPVAPEATSPAAAWKPYVGQVPKDKTSTPIELTGHPDCKLAWIATDAIAIPPEYYGTHRKCDKEWAENSLARSINDEGQHSPIEVHALEGGNYELDFGGHRILACAKLGIPVWAKISNAPEIIRKMHNLSENLARKDFKDEKQRAVAIAMYAREYNKLHPELVGTVKRSKIAGSKSAVKKAEKNGKMPKGAIDAAKLGKTAAQDIAERTGISERSAQKAITRGSRFSADELEVLENRGVASHDQDRIAAIKDDTRRKRAVQAIGTGQPVATVLARFGSKNEGVLVEEVDLTSTLAEVDQTPEQFAVAQPLYKEGNVVKEVFKEQAMAWHTFYYKYKGESFLKNLNRLVGPKALSHPVDKGFTAMVADFCRIKHPMSWKRCMTCEGKGQHGGRPCPNCGGGGFTVK